MDPGLGHRKYFLDWLRVLAFAILILFHIGMLYVTWDYNLKSARQYPDLELAMNSLSAWRLVLLFFIAGVASRFLIEKLSAGGFARDRTRRLLPVILLGMLIINPVQVYVEFLQKGLIEPGYIQFWLGSYLRADTYPGRTLPTWDHLWFLVYLWPYGLGLALWYKARGTGRSLPAVGAGWLIVLPPVWLSLTNILVLEVNPVTHALVDDWANHLRWIGVFATGVICASLTQFWETLRQHRHRLLGMALILFGAQLANGVYYRTGQADPFWDGILYSVSAGMYGWCVVLMLSGYAAHHLNRPSRLLSYLNEAVLPIYVVHQPVMLVCAFVLFPLALPVGMEVAVLVAVVAAGSVGAYELLVRRWPPMRFLFGLKARDTTAQ